LTPIGTGERANFLAARQALVDRARLRHRLLCAHRAERVDFAV
jgi:hypothetical protein